MKSKKKVSKKAVAKPGKKIKVVKKGTYTASSGC